MKRYLSIAAASLLTATLFVGCGSDDLKIGYLIDSAVQGVDYTCGSNSGKTGDKGAFKYESGDECTFSVGKVVIGKAKPETGVKGEGVVTPMDLAGVTDIDDPKVIKISQFILSLNGNGNLDDGIVVEDDTIADLNKLNDTVELTSDEVTIVSIVEELQAKGVEITMEEIPTEEEVKSHLAKIDDAIEAIKAPESTSTSSSATEGEGANSSTQTSDDSSSQTSSDSNSETSTDATTGDCLPGQVCTN